MVDLNFNIANQQLQINLAALPAGCRTVVLTLPDGNHLAHHFNGSAVASPAITLDNLPELIREFVEYLDIHEDLEENTLKGYRNKLAQFTRWLRRNNTHDPAASSRWTAYYASLKQRGLAEQTRKNHYHILNRFGRWLVEKGYLTTHPLAEVNPPQLPKGREPKEIFREHIKAMLKAVDNARDRAILLFFRDAGCRATEAVSLTWGDLQLDF